MSFWRSLSRRVAHASLAAGALVTSPVAADPPATPAVTAAATTAAAPSAALGGGTTEPVANHNLENGEALGEFRMTFYWIADEKEYPGERRVERIHDRAGSVLGVFGERFARALRMEGTARTNTGVLLNWAGRHCGPPRRVVERLRDRRGRIRRHVRMEPTACFTALDPQRYPFGMGVQGYRLIPYRTVAVDLSHIPPATPLYVPEMAGVRLPDGTRHDGCVVAVDTGSGIRGARLDFFVPTQREFREAYRQLPRRSQITVFRDPERCSYARAYAWRPPPSERPVVDPAPPPATPQVEPAPPTPTTPPATTETAAAAPAATTPSVETAAVAPIPTL